MSTLTFARFPLPLLYVVIDCRKESQFKFNLDASAFVPKGVAQQQQQPGPQHISSQPLVVPQAAPIPTAVPLSAVPVQVRFFLDYESF